MSTDRSIDLCYRLLAVMWIAGALSLGYALLFQDSDKTCVIVDCHINKG